MLATTVYGRTSTDSHQCAAQNPAKYSLTSSMSIYVFIRFLNHTTSTESLGLQEATRLKTYISEVFAEPSATLEAAMPGVDSLTLK